MPKGKYWPGYKVKGEIILLMFNSQEDLTRGDHYITHNHWEQGNSVKKAQCFFNYEKSLNPDKL